MGREKISLSKRVKDSVKAAVKHISNFEKTAAEIAIQNEYSHVICGHIHEPVMKKYVGATGTVQYLNSGDWIENLTALEYNNETWSLVRYNELSLDKGHELETSTREISTDIIELQSAFIKHRKVAATA